MSPLKKPGGISDASRQTSLPVLQVDLRIGYGVFARHTRAYASKWRQMCYRERETHKKPCFSLFHGVRYVLRKCMESQTISARN
jgi:hypothetical protein